MKKPKIYTREDWKAKGDGNPAPYGVSTTEELARIYTRATVHHDASAAASDMTLAEAQQRMRDHQFLHMQSNGWGDLGYHYVIAPQGQIFSGRSIFSKGAHVAGANSGNLGICLMGNFETQNVPAPQKAALVELLAWYSHALQFDPKKIDGHSTALKAATGETTACPGSHLFNMLPEIRALVTAKLK